MDGVESIKKLKVFSINSCAYEVIGCQTKVYTIVIIINVKITFTCNKVILLIPVHRTTLPDLHQPQIYFIQQFKALKVSATNNSPLVDFTDISYE